MFSRTVIFCLSLLSYSSWALGPNFTYLGLGYAHQRIDNDCNQSGFQLSGSLALNEIFFVGGEHSDLTSHDWCGLTSTSAHLGARVDISPKSALYGSAILMDNDYGPDSDTGVGAELGLRTFIQDSLELTGFIKYESIDEFHDSTLGGRINYLFADYFSVVLHASISRDNVQTVGLDFRFNLF